MRGFSLILILFPSLALARVRPYLSASIGQANERKEIYSAAIYQGKFGIENKRYGANFSISYLNQANKVKSLQPGRFTLMPLMLNGYIKIPVTKRFGFHGGGGLGWIIANYDQDEIYYKAADRGAIKVRFETKDNQGFQFFGGMDYRVTKTFTLSFAANYLYFSTTVNQKSQWRDRYYHEQNYKQTINLDGLSVFVSGTKYFW